MTIRSLPVGLSFFLLLGCLPGCARFRHHPSGPTPAQPTKASAHAIVTPDASLAAKVLSVNSTGRFVVLNFPGGRLPRIDQHLFLYRNGLKTAEVKISGPVQDASIVADLLAGEAQVGDTVSDQ